jgi:hypothetical protein
VFYRADVNMFTADDLVENSAKRPYEPLAANDELSPATTEALNSKCCSCGDACQCIVVNTHAGAVLGAWLLGVGGGLIGACCIGPLLVLLDFCCFPPKEGHDCAGRMCKVCGVAAAIPGLPASVSGAAAFSAVGLATGLLCAPTAFFGSKPKCYNGASAGLNGVMKGVYDEIRGNEPAPVSPVMR